MKKEQPFLHPHQVNYIRRQLNLLIGAFYFAGDYRVLEASKASAMANIRGMFGELTPEQSALLDDAGNVRDKEEMGLYMHKLSPYVIPFPKLTAAEIRKLFPKVKKLVLPDLDAVPYDKITYLGWRDIATSTMFLVFHNNGKLKGVECRYVPGQKGRAYLCIWCKQTFSGDDVTLVTTQIKNREILGGYKTTGNHLCLNSMSCNAHLTSTDEIQAFLESIK